MPTLEEVFEVLSNLNIKDRYGIAGSYARGTARKRSDIDVVVDTDSLDIFEIEAIKTALKSAFSKKSDVICLGLLKEEDEELDKLALSEGFDINEFSAYKSILREVIWCDEILQKRCSDTI